MTNSLPKFNHHNIHDALTIFHPIFRIFSNHTKLIHNNDFKAMNNPDYRIKDTVAVPAMIWN